MTQILIEVSARHCHLSQQDLDKLFGKGFQLTQQKELSQPDQFATNEKLILKTKDGQIDNLRILGPVRPETQIELAMTDARKLKLNPPIRVSGDIKGSAGGTLIGPKGEVKLKEGIIIAQRHIHCSPAQAKKLGLRNGQLVAVKTIGDRSAIFTKVIMRVEEHFRLSFQVDTDEGNASLPSGVCSRGEIIKSIKLTK